MNRTIFGSSNPVGSGVTPLPDIPDLGAAYTIDAGGERNWAVQATATQNCTLTFSALAPDEWTEYRVAITASGAAVTITYPGGGTVAIADGDTQTLVGYSPDGTLLRTEVMGAAAAAAPAIPDGLWLPDDQGFKLWTFDPLNASSLGAGGLGVAVVRVPVREDFTIANWHTFVTTAGAGFSGSNLGLVFDPSHALIAQTAVDLGTADATTGLGSTGLKTVPMQAEAGKSLDVVAADTPWLHVGYVFNATTRPTTPRKSAPAGSAAFENMLFGAQDSRLGFNTATAVPATLPALTADVNATWLALS
jgi:hypothetical protein